MTPDQAPYFQSGPPPDEPSLNPRYNENISMWCNGCYKIETYAFESKSFRHALCEVIQRKGLIKNYPQSIRTQSHQFREEKTRTHRSSADGGDSSEN